MSRDPWSTALSAERMARLAMGDLLDDPLNYGGGGGGGRFTVARALVWSQSTTRRAAAGSYFVSTDPPCSLTATVPRSAAALRR
jgi:hypothetical protein